jgi:Amidohydrolase
MTVVDIHCHTFNADDLPVRGFLERVVFNNHDLVRDVAVLVDLLIQGTAPGYAEENAYLDHLLSLPTPRRGQRALQPMALPDLEVSVEQAYLELQTTHPALVERLSEEMPRPEGTRALWFGDGARRAVRWVKLFGMRRVDITGHLVANFGGDAVDLFTPMLVDLGMGLDDKAKTTASQQIALQEKISRLSMQGRLPVRTKAQVHPFVGFDPRRELWAQKVGEIVTPFELVQRAVERYGFVGVKMYPPMGFRPTANEPTREIKTKADARKVDQILERLYQWCEDEDVPITVHCNASNDASEDYVNFSHPDLWAQVLGKHKRLHLNLGHFGGTGKTGRPSDWAGKITRLAERYPHLYADVGCHGIHKTVVAKNYEAALRRLVKPSSAMRERLMYGSDWFMLALLPKNEDFLRAYEALYTRAVSSDASAVRSFLGGAALGFLGFSAEERANGNKNGLRLAERYGVHAPDRVPAWLS